MLSSQQQKQDELQLVHLTKVLKKCELIKQFKISMLAITIIAEFSLGYIASCECGIGEILILPSMNQDFQLFPCRDCKNVKCTSIKCYNCIDEENLYSLDPKQYDKSYSINSCVRCDDDTPICINCSFICKGCLDFFCKKHHLKQICATCDAEYCDQEEWEFSMCIGCDRINCSFCKTVLCSYFQTWIDCDEYNGCRFCYCSNIMKFYEDADQYKSCMKIANRLNKEYFNQFSIFIPIHIIQIIAMFLNNNSDDDC